MPIRKQKADEPDDETAPPAEEQPAAGGSLDKADVVEIVKEVVADLIPGGTPPPADETAPPAKAGRKSLRDEEDDMESRVAKEVERIRADEERENRLKAVEEKVTEKPPGQPRKLTRFFGWDREPEPTKR